MMITRIVEQQETICAVLVEDHKYCHKTFTDTDISNLEAIMRVFVFLSYFTVALSGEKHVIAPRIQPLLSMCMKRYYWYLLMIVPL